MVRGPERVSRFARRPSAGPGVQVARPSAQVLRLGRQVAQRLSRQVPQRLVTQRLSGQVTRLSGAAARVPARFTSPLHSAHVAARLGTWLGVSFTVAFVTGLISHFMQHPPDWLLWPSRPVNLYRVTQGVHVIGGLATIPLLLAKLWTVYPKLWQWPPVRSAGHALRRATVVPLVAGALFQLVTGLFNIAYFYPFPFFFTTAHYWTAYIVFGALLIHVANEWAKVRASWTGAPPPLLPGNGSPPRPGGLSRRGLFASVTAACGAVLVTTVGESFSPLARLAVLAPRRPGVGPQGLPVNKTALAAGVTWDPGWRLTVTGGARELSLTLEELRGLPQHVVRLPIACVEGWSAEGTWGGVRLRDVLRMADVAENARVIVESAERTGGYRSSEIRGPHWRDPLTLLALDLGGEPLALDHGYPCRLIAPDRPGVMQTKWVGKLTVLP